MAFLDQGTRFGIVGGLLALLLIAGVWRLAGRESPATGVPASAISPAALAQPPIDLAAPAGTRTATFALG